MENEDRVIAAVEAEVIADRTERCSNLPVTADQVRHHTRMETLLQEQGSRSRLHFDTEKVVPASLAIAENSHVILLTRCR
ncbi:unnamed protein product [Caenorhabditis bovis]|uniref:Uncharacterized protein n=1 Tax=Caenorhabditis bovis TaxID=2654633 RepID=A0A8S1F1A3_9PELO|nr:unnamed protein product [Caenorhabditis bovis]